MGELKTVFWKQKRLASEWLEGQPAQAGWTLQGIGWL